MNLLILLENYPLESALFGLFLLYILIEYIEETHSKKLKRFCLEAGLIYCILALLFPLITYQNIKSIILSDVLDIPLLMKLISYVPIGMLLNEGICYNIRSLITILLATVLSLTSQIMEYYFIGTNINGEHILYNLIGCILGMIIIRILKIRFKYTINK